MVVCLKNDLDIYKGKQKERDTIVGINLS